MRKVLLAASALGLFCGGGAVHAATTVNAVTELRTTCLKCHSDESSEVSCSNSEWTAHNGSKVTTAVYDAVTLYKTGKTCVGTTSTTSVSAATALKTTCLQCHSDKSSKVSCTNSKWTAHNGSKVTTALYDAVTLYKTGKTCTGTTSTTSTTSVSAATALKTTCLQCHSDKSSKVSCTNSKWTAHNGSKVTTALYDAVTLYKTGKTCTGATSTTTPTSPTTTGGAATSIAAHQSIQSYNGPSTCIACHQVEAQNMLNSLHMQWKGTTPELSNAPNQILGKGNKGINTFCTYAMSSGGACFNCHVRADGNAPHAPSVNDIDCLMCHSDTYKRKTTPDPSTAMQVTDYLGQIKTYIFGLRDSQGNYFTEPDYALMPPGTTMTDLARNVHMPTRNSCLRCHAKAGGGDWTKRGDMGVNTAAPTDSQDVHMSPTRGNMSCSDCHAVSGHKIVGRGIDLRQTEGADPKCTDCHSAAPHTSRNANYAKLNRHAAGQVACQTCHIKTFAKGGATEMSRNWLHPVWNPTFCNGQGGYVGEEVKVANVKPEYRFFDGTSYVYNVGERITPNPDGTYTMAKANGMIFDGKSKIVPVKNHWTNIPLLQDGRIVPPAIMWMFMTGDFNQAVQKGMQDQGMVGSYTMVNANAEMLITHGVEPKSMAPTCAACHNGTGHSNLMLPFTSLGYHQVPAKVKDCTLCHSKKTLSWEAMHDKHRSDLKCSSCHNKTPVGLVSATSTLCKTCHSLETASAQTVHREHVQRYACTTCHKF